MGRKALLGTPMTAAQRQARSRENRNAEALAHMQMAEAIAVKWAQALRDQTAESRHREQLADALWEIATHTSLAQRPLRGAAK